MIKKIHIYDMDGCLVDSYHRFRTGENGRIDLDHWLKNCTAEKIARDTLLPLAEQYQADLNDPTIYVVIATARYMKKPDFDFVKKKLGQPDKLVYRRADTYHMRGADMKIAGLRYLKNLKQFAHASIMVFEDNVDYLKGICDHFNCKGIYVPSKQGV